MPEYTVTVTETNVGTITVEADSPDDAVTVAETLIGETIDWSALVEWGRVGTELSIDDDTPDPSPTTRVYGDLIATISELGMVTDHTRYLLDEAIASIDLD